MKKLFIILTIAFSSTLMAKTTIACSDQTTDAEYIVRVSDNSSLMVFSPFTKDDSVFSKSKLLLDLKKDMSTKANSLYAGINAQGNIIIAELRNNQLINGNKANIKMFFSSDSTSVDQETILDCTVNIDKSPRGN